MLEFPSFWKMILDMIKRGSGYVCFVCVLFFGLCVIFDLLFPISHQYPFLSSFCSLSPLPSQEFEAIILPPGSKLREQESVTKLLDISLLPKSIGGDAVSVDDETGEKDERCVRGWKHLTVSAFVRALKE